jgi:nitrogen fixation NifU-like protein
MAMLYGKKLMEHFENPRNVGSFDDGEPNVGTGIVGSPACGDVMKLQIKVDPESGRIVDARFKTFGCGSAIASSSLLTEWVKGKSLEEALEIKNKDVAKELELPPVKVHCSVLAQDALRAAVEDYRKRLAGEKGPEDEPDKADASCGVGPAECNQMAGDEGKCGERGVLEIPKD